jgi:hypothetical protein
VAVKYLLDADLPKALWAALRRHAPTVDVRRVQELGLRMASDEAILEFAARDGRIVVSRDKATMRGFASDRTKEGLSMPGLFLVRPGFAVGGSGIGVLAREFEFIVGASDAQEWEGVVQFVPFLGA